MLAEEICEGSGSALSKARAAMTLAQLGDFSYAASMFDYSNPPSATNRVCAMRSCGAAMPRLGCI